MRYSKIIPFALLLSAFSLAAHAHEFWMRAEPFSPRVGTQSRMLMYVGQYFEGDQVGYVRSHTAMLRHYSAGRSDDLIKLVPSSTPIGEVPIRIDHAGTHLVAFDSFPTSLTLEAGKFEAYLHDEGLDSIVKQREAQGKSAEPGRERFRRNTKTLLRAGDKSDQTFALHTGQRLEIIPLDDPLSKPPGTPLRFQVLFDAKPLSGALLRAWHHHDTQTLSIRATTNESGVITYNFPYAGAWMLSTVHMITSTEPAEADWDSYWGNLMFEIPAR